MKLINNKKLLLGLGLGTIVATVPVALTMSCSCSYPSIQDRVEGLMPKPDKPTPDENGGSSDNGSRPEQQPSLDKDNINELITELPRENIDTNKLQLLPYARLVKYAVQIPRIKDSSTGLALSSDKMRQKYVELKDYAIKFYNAADKVWRDFRENSPFDQGQWDDFDTAIEQDIRIFWNDNLEWANEFGRYLETTRVQNIGVWIMISSGYIQAYANKAVGKIIQYLCDYKIALIDLKKQSNNAVGLDIIKNNANIKQSLKSLGNELYQFFNPLRKSGCLQLNNKDDYFLRADGKNGSGMTVITDNAVGLKYLIMLANQEVGPMVEWFSLNSSSDFSCPNSFDKPLVYKKNGGNGYRDLVKVINKHTGQIIQWYGEFGSEQDINDWFRKWFFANKNLYGWNFNLENNSNK